MPVVTAALAPILTLLKAIPVLPVQRTMLATYSGLLGFLLLAWVCYVRGPLAKAMVVYGGEYFGELPLFWVLYRRLQHYTTNLLPLALIGGSVFCLFRYLNYYDAAIAAKYHPGTAATAEGLAQMVDAVPNASSLMAYYLGIFLFAEMALVVMALREYAYGVLKIPEVKILGGEVAS